jgi:hypothetical protein
MSTKRVEKRKPAYIASAITEAGQVIEMTLNPETKRSALLCWEGDSATEVSEVELPSIGNAVPFSPSNNLIAHGVILFPSRASEYGDADKLLKAIRGFIHSYADLSDQFEEIASLYVMLSWVYDRYRVVPYLRLKGDYGTGKTRCLQVIGSICYKPMFMSGASTPHRRTAKATTLSIYKDGSNLSPPAIQ